MKPIKELPITIMKARRAKLMRREAKKSPFQVAKEYLRSLRR
jgi:hypothetical protein